MTAPTIITWGETVRDKKGLTVGCDIMRGSTTPQLEGRIMHKKGNGFRIGLRHSVSHASPIYATEMEYRFYDTLAQAKDAVLQYFQRRDAFLEEGGYGNAC